MSDTFEIARVHRFKRGSGLPVRIPAIELIEIGAGGGSIARVDELGLLKVGPDSSGADPGPACYGLGGTQPTVTDADLVLGYLNPEYFLGGRMGLDRAAAEEAVARTIADPLQLSVTEPSGVWHLSGGQREYDFGDTGACGGAGGRPPSLEVDSLWGSRTGTRPSDRPNDEDAGVYLSGQCGSDLGLGLFDGPGSV